MMLSKVRRVLLLGAGVQSTTLLLMLAKGELKPVEAAIFADTGWEPPSVYAHLEKLRAFARENGIRLVTVKSKDRPALGDTFMFGAQAPVYVRWPDGQKGASKRACTQRWKIRPIDVWIRKHIIRIAPGRKVPPLLLVEKVFGISYDELHRMKNPLLNWELFDYPLVERKMTREDCTAYLRAEGWTAPRSACIPCPYHSDDEWVRMKQENPADFEFAVEMDEQMRETGVKGLRLPAYFHPSCTPLGEVEFKPKKRDGMDREGDECDGVCFF